MISLVYLRGLAQRSCTQTSLREEKASVWQLNGDGGDLRLFAAGSDERKMEAVMVQSKQAALSSQWASVQSLAALCMFATPRKIQSRSVQS